MLLWTIEPLHAGHAVEDVDCGDDALNRFLVRSALVNQRAHASRTYVARKDAEVVGFHTLVVGEVAPDQAPERVRKGLARHPVPLTLRASGPWLCTPRMSGPAASMTMSASSPPLPIPLHLDALIKDLKALRG